jgi:WD40 repeat protein
LTALTGAQYTSGGGSLRVATGDEHGNVIIWDVESGAQQHTVEAHGGTVSSHPLFRRTSFNKFSVAI